jgi:O-antigen/teichoic acid export membrane protein
VSASIPAGAKEPGPNGVPGSDVEELHGPDAGPSGSATADEGAPPTETDSRKMRRSQVRGSALLVVGRVLTLVLTTATQVIIVRALTQSDFGAFGYALALAAAGRTLLSLGQGKLLSRFMAKYEEERDFDRMFGAMFLAIGTIMLTSTLSLATLFLLADSVISSAVSDPATVKVVLILIFLAPLEALDQVFVSLFAVFSKARTIFFRKYLFTPLLRLVVVLTLALTGSSVTFLAIGYLGAAVVGVVVYLGVFVRVLRERGLLKQLRPSRIILPFRAVFSFSLPLISGELLLLSLNVGGVLILGYFHSAAEVARYRAVFNPARLNTAVLHAFVPLFLPLAARLFTRGDIEGLRRAYWHTGVFVAVLTFPVFALTGPLAFELTVLLFGDAYADSGIVLALLSVGYYFGVVLGFNTYTLQVCERIRFLVIVNVLVAALNIGLSLLLVQEYGAVGVAAANLAALVVQNVVNQWALRRAIGTTFIDRGAVRCYAVIFACAVALWVFQVLVQPPLIVGVAVAAVASFLVLLAGRSAIELGDTFPELQRMPMLRWLVR